MFYRLICAKKYSVNFSLAGSVAPENETNHLLTNRVIKTNNKVSSEIVSTCSTNLLTNFVLYNVCIRTFTSMLIVLCNVVVPRFYNKYR